jgi:hypothetical protein
LKAVGLYGPLSSLRSWFRHQRQLLRDKVDVWRNMPRRAKYMARYFYARIKPAWTLLFVSRELSNFTYDLSDRGKIHFAHAVSIAAGCTPQDARRWIDELAGDEELRAFIVDCVRDSSGRTVTDARADYGRRLGWYALARALKPRLVVETGVDKGLGSLVLCAALRRNAAEGHPGRYLGTDINPSAGELLGGPYATFGFIAYGDSLASLEKLSDPVDLFINDSDHSADYERREYELMAPRLSPDAVIVGDNAHVTDELADFATRTGRRFIAVRELPRDHWYLGATTGIAFNH